MYVDDIHDGNIAGGTDKLVTMSCPLGLASPQWVGVSHNRNVCPCTTMGCSSFKHLVLVHALMNSIDSFPVIFPFARLCLS